MLESRRCGVLLHPTSLPGYGGVGSCGRDALNFIDVLADMGMAFWQVLPLTPPASGNSPYSAFSAFAGNPLLIDCEQLVTDGDLPEVPPDRFPGSGRVDFKKVAAFKDAVLRKAAATFFGAEPGKRLREFWHFCDNTPWLHDYALFMALKRHFRGTPWNTWPNGAALRTPEAYEQYSSELGPEIGFQKYQQWQFFRQWRAVREYAARRGIAIIGDLPIFVAHDSVDVWRHRELFLLDDKGAPRVMAGVPPDYFSASGQLWGNPLYDWDVLKEQGYGWWLERLRWLFSLFDVVRIDHFRGFDAAWHVPAGALTAETGEWVPGPGRDFFDAVRIKLGSVPIIAEDLGVITSSVNDLRDYCGYPGMKILQFAFDSGAANPHLPHNYTKQCVVYTGTHDNDTTRGWSEGLDAKRRKAVHAYTGCPDGHRSAGMLRLALMSVANTAIFPLQDLLDLPSEARMNIPGTAFGNWGWRFTWDLVSSSHLSFVHEMLSRYGRLR